MTNTCLVMIFGQVFFPITTDCYDFRILSCFCLWFCTFIISHHPACLVYYQNYSFTHPASSHTLVFPSHVSVFLLDLSPSTPESVSSHSLVISGFLVFSKRFLHNLFSEFSHCYTNLHSEKLSSILCSTS